MSQEFNVVVEIKVYKKGNNVTDGFSTEEKIEIPYTALDANGAIWDATDRVRRAFSIEAKE